MAITCRGHGTRSKRGRRVAASGSKPRRWAWPPGWKGPQIGGCRVVRMHPAIDLDDLPVDESRLVARQEQRRIRHILRLAVPRCQRLASEGIEDGLRSRRGAFREDEPG